MVREDKSTWKANYFLRLVQLFDEYPKCFLVSRKPICQKWRIQLKNARFSKETWKVNFSPRKLALFYVKG